MNSLLGITREVLENEVKPLASSFLHEKGIVLSEEKPKITSITTGFDFLGCNVRRYNKKLIIKPSKENIKRLLNKAHVLIKANIANTKAVLTRLLNSLLGGCKNYHSHVCAKRAFHKIDHEIICALWKLAKKRHPHSGLRWINSRYFKVMKQRQWVRLCCTYNQEETKRDKVLRLLWLTVYLSDDMLKSADANPLDFKWKKYFGERVKRTKMLANSFSKEGPILLVSTLRMMSSEGL